MHSEQRTRILSRFITTAVRFQPRSSCICSLFVLDLSYEGICVIASEHAFIPLITTQQRQVVFKTKVQGNILLIHDWTTQADQSFPH